MIDSTVAAPPRRRWPSSRTPCGWLSTRTPARIGPAFVRLGHHPHRSEEPPMGDETTVALNRRARHDFTIDETFEAGIVLTGTEIKSLRAGKANLSDAYARDRARRGVAGRRRHRAVRGRQPLQPRAEADPQAAAPPLRDRRAARARPRRRARRSSRSGCTSTRRAGPRSSSGSPAASSSTTAAATSPTATPGATSRASWPTPSAAGRAQP